MKRSCEFTVSSRRSDGRKANSIGGTKFRAGALAVCLFLVGGGFLPGAELPNSGKEPEPVVIDLPTVLRLANAQNLDVQIARERLASAKAAYEGAVSEFFPWVSPGITYRRHDNVLQDVSGNMLDVHKESYAPGANFSAEVSLGDAIYATLAAKQTARAANHAVNAQQQISVLAAAQAYFDLAAAQARVGVESEAERIATNLQGQLASGVSAGLAYKGDELRARVQAGQAAIELRRAEEERRNAGALLAEILHLDAGVDLVAPESEMVPITLVDTNAAMGALVAQALHQRPELEQNRALVEAANSSKNGALYGPLVPIVGGQAYLGGLGGGMDNGPHRFGDSEDYMVYAGWRIGPGGLFDFSRRHLAEAQLESGRLAAEKVKDAVMREVVTGLTRVRSEADQLSSAKETLLLATQAEQLAEQRKEFAVGAILEDIQTQQDLTHARNQLVTIIAEYNKAQYALQKAVGGAATANPQTRR